MNRRSFCVQSLCASALPLVTPAARAATSTSSTRPQTHLMLDATGHITLVDKSCGTRMPLAPMGQALTANFIASPNHGLYFAANEQGIDTNHLVFIENKDSIFKLHFFAANADNGTLDEVATFDPKASQDPFISTHINSTASFLSYLPNDDAEYHCQFLMRTRDDFFIFGLRQTGETEILFRWSNDTGNNPFRIFEIISTVPETNLLQLYSPDVGFTFYQWENKKLTQHSVIKFNEIFYDEKSGDTWRFGLNGKFLPNFYGFLTGRNAAGKPEKYAYFGDKDRHVFLKCMDNQWTLFGSFQTAGDVQKYVRPLVTIHGRDKTPDILPVGSEDCLELLMIDETKNPGNVIVVPCDIPHIPGDMPRNWRRVFFGANNYIISNLTQTWEHQSQNGAADFSFGIHYCGHFYKFLGRIDTTQNYAALELLDWHTFGGPKAEYQYEMNIDHAAMWYNQFIPLLRHKTAAMGICSPTQRKDVFAFPVFDVLRHKEDNGMPMLQMGKKKKHGEGTTPANEDPAAPPPAEPVGPGTHSRRTPTPTGGSPRNSDAGSGRNSPLSGGPGSENGEPIPQPVPPVDPRTGQSQYIPSQDLLSAEELDTFTVVTLDDNGNPVVPERSPSDSPQPENGWSDTAISAASTVGGWLTWGAEQAFRGGAVAGNALIDAAAQYMQSNEAPQPDHFSQTGAIAFQECQEGMSGWTSATHTPLTEAEVQLIRQLSRAFTETDPNMKFVGITFKEMDHGQFLRSLSRLAYETQDVVPESKKFLKDLHTSLNEALSTRLHIRIEQDSTAYTNKHDPGFYRIHLSSLENQAAIQLFVDIRKDKCAIGMQHTPLPAEFI